MEVHILTWRWKQPVEIDSLDARVRVHQMPTSRYYASRLVVPYYTLDLLANHYDFVWVHFACYGEAEALNLARCQRFGIIFHYPYDQCPHRYREFQHSGLAKRATQIVSVSQLVAEGVRECFGRTSAVIHHGVDTLRFTPCSSNRTLIRHSLGLAPESPLLVTVSALEERKGIQWVLRALPHVIRRIPDVTYIVLGEGPYQSALEQLAHELQIENQVRFLGERADITPFYQTADLSLILSRGEASSLTALESLACGIPVIAAKQRPFDELIEPDYGLLIDEQDGNRVADAIGGLLGDPARRQSMGEAGRARILAEFTWDRVGEQYTELMYSIVAA